MLRWLSLLATGVLVAAALLLFFRHALLATTPIANQTIIVLIHDMKRAHVPRKVPIERPEVETIMQTDRK